MEPPSSDLRARVLAAAAASPSLTRRQGRLVAVVLATASVAVAIGIFEAIGGFDHGVGRPLGTTLALAVGWAAAAAVLTWLILGRGGAMMGRRPRAIAAAALGAPLFVLFWMSRFYGTYPEPYQAVGLRCFRYTLLAAALPLGSFLFLRRAVEPRHPGVLGAGAGIVCAAWAGVMVDLWCPLTNLRHVLVGHVAPLFAAAAIGAIAGRFWLGVRSQAKLGT